MTLQTSAITAANALKYPLHLTATALQILQLAALRGYGDEPDLAVCRVLDRGTSLFPTGRI